VKSGRGFAYLPTKNRENVQKIQIPREKRMSKILVNGSIVAQINRKS